jgi:hypothetical protein
VVSIKFSLIENKKHNIFQNFFEKGIYNFEFKIKPINKDIIINENKSSALRGFLGFMLKKTTCPIKKIEDCIKCTLNKTCIYFNIFESYFILDNKNYQRNLYKPFLIYSNDRRNLIPKDDFLVFNVNIFGKYIKNLYHFIYCFIEGGKTFGIGKNKSLFNLIEVKDYYGKIVYKIGNSEIKYKPIPVKIKNIKEKINNIVEIKFNTPVILKEDNKILSDIPFHSIIANIIRKIYLISKYHCETSDISSYTEYSKIKNEMLNKAKNVKIINSNLTIGRIIRYSNRKNKKMFFSGMIGEVKYYGDNLEEFYPYLEAGKFLFIGKNTNLGLGNYNFKIGAEYGQ